jgi:hypothetical protein
MDSYGFSKRVSIMETPINSPSESAVTQGKPKKWYDAKLISFGITPTGYIAIGIAPMGVISIGIVPMGVISIGTVAMGAIAAGFVSMGLITFGEVSMSWLKGHQGVHNKQTTQTTPTTEPKSSDNPTPHHHDH